MHKILSKWFIIIIFLLTACKDDGDSSPPAINIIEPSSYSIVSEIATIKCNVTDNDSVRFVELWVDSIATGIIDSIAPFELLWNTVPYQDSTEHTIIVVAEDMSGNVAYSKPCILIVDNLSNAQKHLNLNRLSFVDYMDKDDFLVNLSAFFVERWSWLAGKIDLSAQFVMQPERSIRLLGVTRFVTDTRGQYAGSFVHQKVAGLDEAHRRFLYGDESGGKRLQNLFECLGTMIQQRMDGAGYCGPVGVDALVYDCPSGRLKLKPVVEVNPRYTMGHLALKLASRVNASRTALWTILRARDVVEAGFDNIGDFAAYMQSAHPCRMTDGGLISSGILFTTDP